MVCNRALDEHPAGQVSWCMYAESVLHKWPSHSAETPVHSQTQLMSRLV